MVEKLCLPFDRLRKVSVQTHMNTLGNHATQNALSNIILPLGKKLRKVWDVEKENVQYLLVGGNLLSFGLATVSRYI